jgi:hypothetical protein
MLLKHLCLRRMTNLQRMFHTFVSFVAKLGCLPRFCVPLTELGESRLVLRNDALAGAISMVSLWGNKVSPGTICVDSTTHFSV